MGKIRVCGGEVERGQKSTGLPTAPLNQWRNGVAVHLHSQILRIREEDSLIGEDTVDVLSKYFCSIDDDKHRHVASVIVFSKPMLPASPLRESTAIVTPD